MGVAPVFTGPELLVAAVVAPDPAGRLVVGRHEAVLIAHAAIVRGFDLVPHDLAVRRDAVCVDAHCLDLTAHHQPMQPRLSPLDLALEVAMALGDARRPELARWDWRESGLEEFVLAATKGQAADQRLVEHGLFERHDIDHELAGCEHVVMGVLAAAAGERDVHRVVRDPGAGAEARRVDTAAVAGGRGAAWAV